MEAAPEVLGLQENLIFGPHLDVADHFPGKMLKEQGTDGRAGATVEALQGRVHPVGFEFFGKIRVYQGHVRSSCRRAPTPPGPAPSPGPPVGPGGSGNSCRPWALPGFLHISSKRPRTREPLPPANPWPRPSPAPSASPPQGSP